MGRLQSDRPGPGAHRSGAFWRHPIETVRHCLGWRLVFLLAISLTILLGASGLFGLRLQEEHLEGQLRESAADLGEMLLSATHFAMLENDWRHIEQIVDNVASSERVVAARLIRFGGEVVVSTDTSEVGKKMDVRSASCQVCHDVASAKVPSSVREGMATYPDLAAGSDVLGLVVPVLNTPECANAACHVHPVEDQLLGLLDVEVSSATIQHAMASTRRQLWILSAITLLMVCTVTGVLAWRVVHIPFHTILASTRRIGEGDLEHRLDLSLAGELGELASAFNSMAERVGTARSELEAWNQTLEDRVGEKTRELERARDTMVFTEKMVSLGKLASIVAHEINNPLAGILVAVKLLRKRVARIVPVEEDRKKADDTLHMIERETARSGDIVRNLLLFSRQRDLSMAPEQLGELVRRAVKLVQHKADLQSVDMIVEIADDVPEVVCDGNQIEQACLAVIMNAIEAMHDGGELRVNVQRSAEEHVEISVEDTGGGIPEEIRMKIFEPFFSTKAEGQGTGLGLSVMYGIVQRHGGQVKVESELGRGTKMRIVLPLSAVEATVGGPDSMGG